MKNLKMSIVQDPSPFGLYVWKLPNGEIYKNDEGNILNIPSLKGDKDKIKNIQDAAKSYGEPEGEAVFIPGVGRVSEEEYQQDLYLMKEGYTPYGDTGAWRDAGRATRALNQGN
jgi:hypothetical protein